MNDYFNIKTSYEGFNKEAVDRFLSLLHHDGRDGGVVFVEKSEGKFSESGTSASKTVDGITHTYVGKPPIPDDPYSSDLYVSVNTCKEKRDTKHIFNVTSMAIDIDWHKGETDLEKIKSLLNDAFNNKKLPVPTMISFTGRGICVFYTLRDSIPVFGKSKAKRSAKRKRNKTLEFYKAVYAGLFDAYDDVLKPVGITVDRNVSDMARLVRRVGSVNQKAYAETGDMSAAVCRLILDSGGLYNLYELNEFIPKHGPAGYSHMGANFFEKRMELLKGIAKLRNYDVEGQRDSLIYRFASTVSNVYKENEVLDKTLEFNNTFIKPWRDNEVRSVVKSVLRKKNEDGSCGYKTKNETLIKEFGLTEEEIKVLRIGEGKRAKEREEKRNVKRMMHERIISLYKKGLSCAEIRDGVNCSLATVYNVIKRAGISCKQESGLIQVVKELRDRMAAIWKSANECSENTLTHESDISFSKKRHCKVVIKDALAKMKWLRGIHAGGIPAMNTS